MPRENLDQPVSMLPLATAFGNDHTWIAACINAKLRKLQENYLSLNYGFGVQIVDQSEVSSAPTSWASITFDSEDSGLHIVFENPSCLSSGTEWWHQSSFGDALLLDAISPLLEWMDLSFQATLQQPHIEWSPVEGKPGWPCINVNLISPYGTGLLHLYFSTYEFALNFVNYLDKCIENSNSPSQSENSVNSYFSSHAESSFGSASVVLNAWSILCFAEVSNSVIDDLQEGDALVLDVFAHANSGFCPAWILCDQGWMGLAMLANPGEQLIVNSLNFAPADPSAFLAPAVMCGMPHSSLVVAAVSQAGLSASALADMRPGMIFSHSFPTNQICLFVGSRQIGFGRPIKLGDRYLVQMTERF